MGNTHDGQRRGRQPSRTPRSNSAATASRCSTSTRPTTTGLFPSRISQERLIYVTSQLAIMVDTGITLSAALAGIVEQETEPDAAQGAERAEGGGRRRRGFFHGPGPPSQATSTRPTSRWSRPARPPARWARCSTASPATSARRWRPAARSARRWPIPTVMMVAGHRRDDLPADLHPAEVHAAVQVEGDASCPAPTLIMMALSDALLQLLVPVARSAPWPLVVGFVYGRAHRAGPPGRSTG